MDLYTILRQPHRVEVIKIDKRNKKDGNRILHQVASDVALPTYIVSFRSAIRKLDYEISIDYTDYHPSPIVRWWWTSPSGSEAIKCLARGSKRRFKSPDIAGKELLLIATATEREGYDQIRRGLETRFNAYKLSARCLEFPTASGTTRDEESSTVAK